MSIGTQLLYFRNDLSQDRIERTANLQANPFDAAVQNFKIMLKNEEELRIQILKKINFIG